VEVEATARAYAPRARIWEVLTDVEGWSGWNRAVRSAARLEPEPLDIGSRVRLHQLGLLPDVWTVTDLIPGRTFTWVARMPGVRLRTTHTLTPLDDALVMVHVTTAQTGLLGRLIAPLTRRRTRRLAEQTVSALAEHVDGRHRLPRVA
jgi:hypothetical protein